MLKQIAPFIGPLVIVLVLMWRMSRSMKGRPVKRSLLWIRPTLIAVFMVPVFASSALPSWLWLAVFALAAVLGVVLGYFLALHQEFALDPVKGTIMSKTSPIGVFLFVGLFAARFAFRYFMNGGLVPDKVAAHSTQITSSTDAGLLFLLGLVCAQAWEIWRRTRPLVAEHVSGRAAESAGE